MKILIACYASTGKTFKISKDLEKKLDADLTKIEPVKDKHHIFQVWDALGGKQVPIKPCINDLSNYDALIVCSSVQAGKTPAAVNEYLSIVKHAKDKNFAVIISIKGDKNQKAALYIREYLSEEGMNFLGQMIVLENDVKKVNYKDNLDFFSRKFK